MENVEIIEEFLRIQEIPGSGFGFGSGFGYGSGSGFSNGSGFGDGDGYGSGFGDGSGCGYGEEDSSGSGSGEKNGSGDGSGYGAYVDLVAFNGDRVWYIDDIPTLIDHVYAGYAKGRIIENDFTTKDCFIVRIGNCFAHGETLCEAAEKATAKVKGN